jgi:hypothetical protein
LINKEISMKKSVLAFLKGIVSVVAVLVFVIAISGCQKQEGAMEKAGEKVGEGAEATKGAMEKAGEKVDKAVGKAGKKVGEGADKTVDAVKKAADKVEEKVKK